MPLHGQLWVLGQDYKSRVIRVNESMARIAELENLMPPHTNLIFMVSDPKNWQRPEETDEQFWERRRREDRIERLWNRRTLFETIQ
jgi:hypothetical protein